MKTRTGTKLILAAIIAIGGLGLVAMIYHQITGGQIW